VVLRDGAAATPQELSAFLEDKVAKWWLPERWTYIAEVPRTSVGKFDKKVLRAQYADKALQIEVLG
jgi:fatty-acyl-CoA synthase